MTIKEKIVAISNEIRVGKDGKNAFQGFSYFRPDDIAMAINPLLAKYEIIFMFNMYFDAVSQMYQCTLTVEDIKSEERLIYRMDSPLTHVKGASEAQGAGATMTYIKRYLIQNIVNLAENGNDLDSKSDFVDKSNSEPIKGLKNDSTTIPTLNLDTKDEPCFKCDGIMRYKSGHKENYTWQRLTCDKCKEVSWLPKIEDPK